MQKFGRLIGLGIFALAAATLAAGDTLEEVEKKLDASWAKLKSYSSKMSFRTEMDMQGSSTRQQYEGQQWWMRKGDKVMFRAEQKGKMEIKYGDQGMTTESTMVSVCDGDMITTLTDSNPGGKQAMKMKADLAQAGAPKEMLKSLKAVHNFKVLGDEKVDGRDCYVLEATPKEAGEMGTTRYFFDKECALALKVLQLDKSGKQIGETTITDLKLGADISPDKFVLKIPEGVEVQDMSKMMPPTGEAKPNDDGEKKP